jgi:beta-mannosidase
MTDNLVWRHRGEWWDTYQRTVELFGSLAPEDLEAFVACSQFIQAEGLRYALEANRRRAFQNCGSIIWQYNEPCPNVSGTNLEDYYGRKKLAYGYVRGAFRPLTPSLRYQKLVWQPGERASLQSWVLNDAAAFNGTLTTIIQTAEGQTLLRKRRKALTEENRNRLIECCEITILSTASLIITLLLESKAHTVCSRYLLFVEGPDGTIDKERILYENSQWNGE